MLSGHTCDEDERSVAASLLASAADVRETRAQTFIAACLFEHRPWRLQAVTRAKSLCVEESHCVAEGSTCAEERQSVVEESLCAASQEVGELARA